MRAIIFAFSLMFPALALAAPDEAVVREMVGRTGLPADEIRQNYNACDSGVTLSMKICANYRWTVEDIRLNRIYKQSLAKSKDVDLQKSLIVAERAWIAYRDAACRYEGAIGAGGGTAEGLYVLSCKEDLTKQRADRLADGLKN